MKHNPSIVADRISHRFPKTETSALSDVSFEIPGTGSISAILGPNGAGKTTLVRVLTTLILPTSGQARIGGFDLVKQVHQVRQIIGLCSDNQRAFYFRLTGKQNLEFFGGLSGVRGRELSSRIANAATILGITDALDTPFMHYSHGMRKKLAIARSLLNDPQVLILDEPTSNLDPCSAIVVRDTLSRLRAVGKTVLITTHNIAEADKLADLVLIMREGRLVAFGSPSHLSGALSHKKLTITFSEMHLDPVRLVESRVALEHALGLAPDVLSVSSSETGCELHISEHANVSAVLRCIADSGLPVSFVSEYEPSLEDLFVQLARR